MNSLQISKQYYLLGLDTITMLSHLIIKIDILNYSILIYFITIWLFAEYRLLKLILEFLFSIYQDKQAFLIFYLSS